ncbi:hypothetical protein QJS66_18075 [Kocuria rhizophila]|nr:hypothetical protein QJS66_18075 [Kocuria rhizophila]
MESSDQTPQGSSERRRPASPADAPRAPRCRGSSTASRTFVRRGDRLSPKRQKAWTSTPVSGPGHPRVMTDTSVDPHRLDHQGASDGCTAVVEIGSGLGGQAIVATPPRTRSWTTWPAGRSTSPERRAADEGRPGGGDQRARGAGQRPRKS